MGYGTKKHLEGLKSKGISKHHRKSFKPVKSFIHYIYEPNKQALEKTGLSVARTAAQLLHLKQYKEANRLAELALQLKPIDDRLWSILAEAQLNNNLIEVCSKLCEKSKKLKVEIENLSKK